MRKPKFTLSLLVIAVAFCVEAQNVSFAYDEAGNRIKRELSISAPIKTKSRSSDADRPFYDTVGERIIKITSNSDGIINISVQNFEKHDNGSIEVYSMSGILLLAQKISDTLTTIDIGSQPNAVYLLKVIVNDNQTIWKIMKN